MTPEDRAKFERRVSVPSAAEQQQRFTGSQWRLGSDAGPSTMVR